MLEAQTLCNRLQDILKEKQVVDPSLRVASFDDESGVISLVAQSIDSDRRLTVDIHGSGLNCTVYTVNERTEVNNEGLGFFSHYIDHPEDLKDLEWFKRLAEWVILLKPDE